MKKLNEELVCLIKKIVIIKVVLKIKQIQTLLAIKNTY